MADASVRPARPADVERIAQIQIDTWRTAYAGLLPESALESVTEELARNQWAAAVGDPPSAGHLVLVAQEGATVVGFAAAEPTAEDATSAEIATLLVEPRWGRRGHGSRLLAAIVDLSRDAGVSRLTAWVLERDQASVGFYESAGWQRDGWARTLELNDAAVREIRLHAAIDEEAA